MALYRANGLKVKFWNKRDISNRSRENAAYEIGQEACKLALWNWAWWACLAGARPWVGPNKTVVQDFGFANTCSSFLGIDSKIALGTFLYKESWYDIAMQRRKSSDAKQFALRPLNSLKVRI